MQTTPSEWKEIGAFIRSCREKAEPLTGFSAHGRSRQRSHLTQTELAQLANVSTVLVSKLEQGQYENINPGILKRIAGALNLTDDDEQFMTGLLIPSPAWIDLDETVPEWIAESVSVFAHPTAIVNPCFDILTWNSKLLGFLGDVSAVPATQRNVIVSMFCNPSMKQQISDWEGSVRVLVGSLRMIYSLIPPYRVRIQELVTQVAGNDATFARMWHDTPPKLSNNMNKRINHPILGDMHVNEMVTQIVGTPFLFRVEFIPANDATRQKMERL